MSLRRLRRARERRKGQEASSGSIVTASSKTSLVVLDTSRIEQKPDAFQFTGLPQPVDDTSGCANDEQLVELWLHTGKRRSEHTRRAYRRDAESFRQYLAEGGKDLRTARVRDVQQWFEGVQGAIRSRARCLAAVRSLFSFATKTGYLGVNVAMVVDPPEIPNELAERILTELEVQALMKVCRGGTLRIVRFLYATGARIDEACKFCWKHLHHSPNGSATATLHGKRNKTRFVPVSPSVAAELKEFRGEAGNEELVFRSKKGKKLNPVNVTKAIRRAAKRAGIDRNVSAHWLRHANASHALDHGAPVNVVKESLGHESLATTGMYTHIRPGDGSGMYLPLLK